MAMKTTYIRDPNSAYKLARDSAFVQMERIKTYLDGTPESVPDWRMVSDMQELERELHLICDRLYQENEYRKQFTK